MADARPKSFNERVIDDFHAHNGRITSRPFTGRSLLLLTTKGAKTGDERRRLYDQHAAKMPAFTEYEKKTTRRIPVVVLQRI